MKTQKIRTAAAALILGAACIASAQQANETPVETPAAEAVAPAPGEPAPSKPVNGETGLRLNFRGVPLEMVLDYLSDAAGFIIVKETEVKGKVDVWSNQPLNKDEAVDLLNTVLNKNEYAAIRNGRTLTIVSREEAKKRDIPVVKGGSAADIPKTDEMVTQVIPVRRANVSSLISNLQPLIRTYAEMSPNESANSLILTATQSDIKRITEIINALDESISTTSGVKVFPLQYADAKELATAIKELFAPTQTQGNNTRGGGGGNNPFQNFFQRGGGGGGFGGGEGGNRGGNTGRGGASNTVNARITAVADERSNSLIVVAPDDTMGLIEDVIKRIDEPVDDITELRVFRLTNSDPLEMADMLATLFPDETGTTTRGGNNQRFQFNRGGGRGGFGAATSSERAKKQGRVLAVPDQRTGSIVVSAASEMMPQIAEMIAQLDSNPAKKQKVYVYSLENADVQQVEGILREMFERTTTQNNRNNNNQDSALTTRSTQNQGGSFSTGANSAGGRAFGNNQLGGNRVGN